MGILSLLPRGEGHTEFLEWSFCPSFRGEKDILSSYSGHSVPPSEGRRAYWSYKKSVGSDKIFFAFCRVLDLYNCCKLVSGIQHPAILQEMT